MTWWISISMKTLTMTDDEPETDTDDHPPLGEAREKNWPDSFDDFEKFDSVAQTVRQPRSAVSDEKVRNWLNTRVSYLVYRVLNADTRLSSIIYVKFL